MEGTLRVNLKLNVKLNLLSLHSPLHALFLQILSVSSLSSKGWMLTSSPKIVICVSHGDICIHLTMLLCINFAKQELLKFNIGELHQCVNFVSCHLFLLPLFSWLHIHRLYTFKWSEIFFSFHAWCIVRTFVLTVPDLAWKKKS